MLSAFSDSRSLRNIKIQINYWCMVYNETHEFISIEKMHGKNSLSRTTLKGNGFRRQGPWTMVVCIPCLQYALRIVTISHTGHIRVLYNRREVSTLIAGQSFSDLGMLSLVNIASIFGHAKCVHGASFVAAARSLVLVISYDRFLEYVHGLGPRADIAVRNFLTQSDSIGRETWSAYGSVSIICCV
jgi:hypothetical protein